MRPTANRSADMLEQIRASGRTILTEYESKAGAGRLWHPDHADAHRHQRRRGGPSGGGDWATRWSLKLHSETITHKTDIGGVMLNLADAARCAARLPADPSGGDRKSQRRGFPWALPCSRW